MDVSERIQRKGMRLVILDVDHEANGSGWLVAVSGGATPARGGAGGGSPKQAITSAPIH
jgi:hypothetical protein